MKEKKTPSASFEKEGKGLASVFWQRDKIFAFREKGEVVAWILFFISLFLPVNIQIGEDQSFWSGVFSPFSTVFWPGSFFFGSLALIVSAISFFGKSVKQKGQYDSLPIFAWIFFFLWGVVSLQIHGWNAVGIMFLLHWLLLGVIAFVVGKQVIPFPVLVSVFGSVAIVETVIAVFQTVPSFLSAFDFPVGAHVLRSEYGEILRASGTLSHPNVLGFFLSFVFFFTGMRGSTWRKVRYLFLLGVLCTFSRSAFLAVIFGGLLEYIVSFDRKNFYSKTPIFLLPVCVFGLFLRHFFDTFSPSNVERLSQLSGTWRILQEYWFQGVGIGNFASHVVQLDTFFPWQLQPVHNAFFLIASEMGIIGLFAFMTMFLWAVWKAFHLQNRDLRPLVVGVFGVLTVFALLEHLLVTSVLGMILFAVFLGVSVSQDKD